jgi:hypothetical protein
MTGNQALEGAERVDNVPEICYNESKRKDDMFDDKQNEAGI